MTKKIRGAVLREFGKPVSIEEFTIDDPAENEVLVRTAACGVCHSDLHFQHGAIGGALPIVMGHEPAGIIEAVGSAVQSVKPGDHVVACNILFCGKCKDCLSGRLYFCQNRAVTQRSAGKPPRLSQNGKELAPFGDIGGFADAMLLHENAVVRIDEDIPLDRAALIGCGLVTGLGAVFNTSRVKPCSTVAVFGCGGVGMSVIQGARIAGARQIIAIDLVPAKLEKAIEFGATHTVLAGGNENVIEKIMMISGGGVDYAFDVVGHPAITAQCLTSLTRRGVAVIVGVLPLDKPLIIDMALVHFMSEKILTGSFMGSTRFPIEIPHYLDLYRQKRLNLDSMVSARVPLEGLNEALTKLEKGDVLTRTVITFDI